MLLGLFENDKNHILPLDLICHLLKYTKKTTEPMFYRTGTRIQINN